MADLVILALDILLTGFIGVVVFSIVGAGLILLWNGFKNITRPFEIALILLMYLVFIYLIGSLIRSCLEVY